MMSDRERMQLSARFCEQDRVQTSEDISCECCLALYDAWNRPWTLQDNAYAVALAREANIPDLPF